MLAPFVPVYWADIGGFRGGAPTLGGCQPIIWQFFCQKLHENERNWTEKGRAYLAPTLDPPLARTKRLAYITPLHLQEVDFYFAVHCFDFRDCGGNVARHGR